jgi:hypothetical protein
MGSLRTSPLKTNLLNIAVLFSVMLLFVLAAFQGYENHLDTQLKWDMFHRLMTDPHARLDAWTGSDDNQRTKLMCGALMSLSPNPLETSKLLPSICRVHSHGID